MKKQEMIVRVDGKTKVYPEHSVKEKCCYYEASDLIFPKVKQGIIGGYFDELFTLEKGKTYKIVVEQIK